MNASSLDQIASAVITAFPKLSEPEQHAALALYRLLAKGRPVTAEELSAASGVPEPAVHDMLARWHGVQRSADGAVTAFWGLTLSTSVIESFCCHVHFFASHGAGKEWAGSHASAFLLSLSDAWQIGARKNAAQYSVALAGG